MQSVGCLFCQTRGTVSNVNQHLRNYVIAADEGRTTKGCEFHNLDIIKAFMQQNSKSRIEIAGITDDRMEVLLEFAKHATTAPMSPEDSKAWRRRQYWDRDSNWWGSHVQEVDELYIDSGHNLRKMRDKTSQIVERSIRHSLKKQWGNDGGSITDSAGRVHDQRTVVAASAIGGTQANSIRRANPGDTNQLNMQGDGARFTRREEVCPPPPPPPARKKSGYQMYHRVSSGDDDNDSEDDNDDEDDEDDRRYVNAAGPSTAAPPQIPPKRTSASATSTQLRSVPTSSHPSSNIIPARPHTFSSLSNLPSKTTILTTNNGIAEMGPFLSIDLWGIDNRRSVLPISYGTTLAGALSQACPAILKKNDIKVCFEGVEGSDWAGEWTEWRWELLMEAAEAEHLRVELRLAVVVN